MNHTQSLSYLNNDDNNLQMTRLSSDCLTALWRSKSVWHTYVSWNISTVPKCFCLCFYHFPWKQDRCWCCCYCCCNTNFDVLKEIFGCLSKLVKNDEIICIKFNSIFSFKVIKREVNVFHKNDYGHKLMNVTFQLLNMCIDTYV